MRLQCVHHHVVERRQGPDDQNRGQGETRSLLERAPQPVIFRLRPDDRRRTRPRIVNNNGAHSCTSEVRSLRIRISTNGIISGNAVITAATRSGRAMSKASRMPRVAKTCVVRAGPPPETKAAVLKSPSVKIVESRVQTR